MTEIRNLHPNTSLMLQDHAFLMVKRNFPFEAPRWHIN